MKAKLFVPVLAVVAMALAGCEGTGTMAAGPNAESQNTALAKRSHDAVEQMEAQDSSLRNRVENAYGYAIFPAVGEAAVGIGGAGGKGVVYQQGKRVGFATMNQGSVGAQVGGATFAELILFRDANAMAAFKNGNFTVGGDAQATAVKAGAAASNQFGVRGTQVFILPQGGLMAGVALDGQVIHYTADNNNSSSSSSSSSETNTNTNNP
jgi:lipid-binding SYLF domain-containing protein